MTDWLFPALCGLLTGILSSWGVGGGTLLLLCMTLFFGVEQRTAQAINLLYFLPTAGISLFAHRKNGYLDKAVLRAAIPTGTLCALAAAFLTTMVDSSVFRKPFGLFLLYAGLSILFEKKKNSKKETPRLSSWRFRFYSDAQRRFQRDIELAEVVVRAAKIGDIVAALLQHVPRLEEVIER